ncbi:MAG TPA: peptide ABC transporter substrate-binding protein [Clostridiaceae bacterium]|nr:peptide ABC transporter substrate-binding protein [Clostridiaceae bacterium]
MKRVLLTIAVFAVCVIFASCGTMVQYQDGQEHNLNNINMNIYISDNVIDRGVTRGGTLNLFTTVPDTLNPVSTKNVFVQGFSGLVFESLIKLQENQSPLPVLADRWSVSQDGLVWTFHIREDVKWHDGTPLTAEDVEFTVNEILNSGNGSIYKSNLQGATSFGAIDRNNFRIVIGKPNSFQAELMTFPIIPKHYFEKYGDQDLMSGTLPPGTGPYKFKSIEKDKVIHLTANENWWNALSRGEDSLKLPYIENINVKIYQGVEDALNAFNTKDVDVAFIDFADLERYKGSVHTSLKTYPSRNFEFIALNFNNKILSDGAVRKAIAYSIDRNKIINDILPGRGIISDIPVIPSSWINDTSISSYNVDLVKAREILIENGWNEDNGRWSKRINGKREYLSFELLVNNENLLRKSVAEEIVRQLKNLGIEVTVVPLNWDEMLEKIESGKYDMALMGCTVPQIPDISFLYATPYFSFIPSEGYTVARNISGYTNPDVDDYIIKIFSETDNERKKALFINMTGLISDDVPYLGLYFLNNAVMYRKTIRGTIDSHIWDKYNDITQWYITEG